MTTLRWLQDRFLPELIHLNPMVALAFYHSIAMDSADEAVTGPPRLHISRPRRGVAVLELADRSAAGVGQTVTRAGT